MSSRGRTIRNVRRRALDHRWRGTGHRSGAAAVEAALVLPLLGLIALGCADLGRAIHAQIAITNVARVGAEYGATHRFTPDSRAAWETRLRDAAMEEAANVDRLSLEGLVIDVKTEEEGNGELRIHVSAAVSVDLVISWPGLPQKLVLRHLVAMPQYR